MYIYLFIFFFFFFEGEEEEKEENDFLLYILRFCVWIWRVEVLHRFSEHVIAVVNIIYLCILLYQWKP
jgi:hypothetical protein